MNLGPYGSAEFLQKVYTPFHIWGAKQTFYIDPESVVPGQFLWVEFCSRTSPFLPPPFQICYRRLEEFPRAGLGGNGGTQKEEREDKFHFTTSQLHKLKLFCLLNDVY